MKFLSKSHEDMGLYLSGRAQLRHQEQQRVVNAPRWTDTLISNPPCVPFLLLDLVIELNLYREGIVDDEPMNIFFIYNQEHYKQKVRII